MKLSKRGVRKDLLQGLEALNVGFACASKAAEQRLSLVAPGRVVCSAQRWLLLRACWGVAQRVYCLLAACRLPSGLKQLCPAILLARRGVVTPGPGMDPNPGGEEVGALTFAVQPIKAILICRVRAWRALCDTTDMRRACLRY
jgi:hypothetical protein